MEKELEDGKTRWDRIVRLERATSGLCFYSGTLFLQRDFVSTMELCLGGNKARWYGSFKADNGNIRRRGGRSEKMEREGSTAFCDDFYNGKLCWAGYKGS